MCVCVCVCVCVRACVQARASYDFFGTETVWAASRASIAASSASAAASASCFCPMSPPSCTSSTASSPWSSKPSPKLGSESAETQLYAQGALLNIAAPNQDNRAAVVRPLVGLLQVRNAAAQMKSAESLAIPLNDKFAMRLGQPRRCDRGV